MSESIESVFLHRFDELLRFLCQWHDRFTAKISPFPIVVSSCCITLVLSNPASSHLILRIRGSRTGISIQCQRTSLIQPQLSFNLPGDQFRIFCSEHIGRSSSSSICLKRKDPPNIWFFYIYLLYDPILSSSANQIPENQIPTTFYGGYHVLFVRTKIGTVGSSLFCLFPQLTTLRFISLMASTLVSFSDLRQLLDKHCGTSISNNAFLSQHTLVCRLVYELNLKYNMLPSSEGNSE